MAETGRLALRGSLFVALSDYLLQVVSIVFSIVLTRQLAPDDFGILAMATVIYSVIERPRIIGLPQLLIARQDPSDQVIGTHFALSTFMSASIGILVLALSPMLLRFYSRQTVYVLLCLAAIHLFDNNGLSATTEALLTKELHFGRLSTLHIIATISSLLLAIAAAVIGLGVWSLVIREGVRIIIQCTGTWILTPRRPRWSFDWQTAKDFLRQGWHMWVSGLSGFVVFNYDDFLVGNLLGDSALGLYSRAYHYAKLPMSPLAPVYSVTAPTYARLHADAKRLSRAYELLLTAVVLIAFPAAALMALAAPELVTILLTDRWGGVAPLLRFLLPYSLLRSIRDGTYSLVVALGQPQVLSRIGVVESVVMVIACTLLTWWFGAAGAAISAAIPVLIGLVLLHHRFLRHAVSVDYWGILLRPLLSLLAGILCPVALLAIVSITAPGLRLAIKLGLGGAIFGLSLFLLQRQRLVEELSYIYRLAVGKHRPQIAPSDIDAD
ncbi:MAG: oligosaccharide flippase family protein [Chloroflexi bacterium]|nr:oligosaccharide flippase family protein [Chloroflexota bacterium]